MNTDDSFLGIDYKSKLGFTSYIFQIKYGNRNCPLFYFIQYESFLYENTIHFRYHVYYFLKTLGILEIELSNH